MSNAFDIELMAGAAASLGAGGAVLAMTVTHNETGETGKFKFIGSGLGLLTHIGFRMGKFQLECEADAFPSISAFKDMKARVTTGSFALLAGVGYTRITFYDVGGCRTATLKRWHGEVGGAGLGIGTYRGSVMPVALPA